MKRSPSSAGALAAKKAKKATAAPAAKKATAAPAAKKVTAAPAAKNATAAPAAKKAKKEMPKLLRGDKLEARMLAEAQNMRRGESTLWKFSVAERKAFGHLYGPDIVDRLKTMCDNVTEAGPLKGKYFERARAKVYKDYGCCAKKVLSFFRRYCDREKLMRRLLAIYNDFPWRVIKDPELEQDPDYLKWERSYFEAAVTDGNICLQDYSKALRSDPECVVLALVSAGPKLSDTWQHALVEPTLNFAECVYGEFFTDAEDKESINYVAKFLVKELGVAQDKVNEMIKFSW
jgi:hypothetical protein